MTKNYYETEGKNYRSVYFTDFDRRITLTEMADHIMADLNFDRRCKTLAENKKATTKKGR